jgi:hypothetical protein
MRRMTRSIALLTVALVVVVPVLPAEAATAIKGSLRGPTEYCPEPPNTFQVSGKRHGRFTLSIGDDRTATVTIVARHLAPNTTYPVHIATLKDTGEGFSECTSTQVGTFTTDANGNGTFTGTTTLDTVSWPPGTYQIQVVVGQISLPGRLAAFLSSPRTVTL